MKTKQLIIIITAFLLASCSRPDNITLSYAKYKYDKQLIFSFELVAHKFWQSPLSHSGPKTAKLKVVPFIIELRNKSPYFVRYCKPIDFQSTYEPFDENELKRINGKIEIEKSCKLIGISPLTEAETGGAWGFRESEDDDENKNGKEDIRFWMRIYEEKIGKYVEKTIHFPPPDVWM
jgi:hypothetical protein